jgi:hypothetical protein
MLDDSVESGRLGSFGQTCGVDAYLDSCEAGE